MGCSRSAALSSALVVMVWAAVLSAQARRWVPAVAHADGAAGSVWRTDVSVLNACATATTVELRLHRQEGVSSATFVVPAGGQQLFEDVVSQLVSGSAVGSLEVLSDQEVVVRSRTYDLSANGSFGQSLDGIPKGRGIDLDEAALVGHLAQSSSFRSNIGVLNMGDDEAEVAIGLYDRQGGLVGSYTVTVPGGELRQDNAPFAQRFGRTNIIAGYASARVSAGSDVFVYGSVIDNETNDPTTIVMEEWDDDGCDRDLLLDHFFSLEAVHSVDITVDDAGVRSLLDAPRQYVHADVQIDNTFLADVGVRLKGGAGSFIPLDGDYPPVSGAGNCKPGKSAFIIDLNRYVQGLDLDGLEKLTLNNMVQDPSGIHEYLGYALFREAEVPASRSGFAIVSFNGEDKGIYALIEPPDNDELLERWLGAADGNLYEGAYGSDLRPEHLQWFDQDHGDDHSRRDLSELIAALDAIPQGTDPLPVLELYFDLDEYLDFAATELYLGHWDGYAWSSNNYFLYHDLHDGLWRFLPWGIDQLFEDELWPYGGVMRTLGPSWGLGAGRVHELCMSSIACRARIHQAFGDVIARVDTMRLDVLATAARDLVEPYLLAEASEFGDPEVTRRSLDRVQSFIAARGDQIEQWLPCLIGTLVDHDHDGTDGCTEDCNDWEASIYPGAVEVCNFADDDCNGIIDDPPQCPRCLVTQAPDGRQYSLCFDRLDWLAALQECRRNGLDLASIHDLESFGYLMGTAIERLWVFESWIGLNDRAEEGTFEWSDGSDLDFEPWAWGCPKPWGEEEDCVLSAPWGWCDVRCSEHRAYICKVP